jgi:serine/threonine protein kinase
MAATSSIKNIWKLLEKFKKETTLLTNEEALAVLVYIRRHDGIKTDDLIKKLDTHIDGVKDSVVSLKSNEFIIEKNGLIYVTEKGDEIVKIIEYSQYNIDDIPEDVISGYILEKPAIGRGSTSVTFKAGKKMVKNKVIKIFKSGIFDDIDFDKKIEALQKLPNLPNLVLPDDYGELEWNSGKFRYIIMKYIVGRTLKDFLQKKVDIDLRKFIDNFLTEVGKTLERVEESGLSHEDLHSNNILVVEDEIEKGKKIYHFQIIDFIGIKSHEEFREFELSDFEYFKQHLLKIVKVYAPTPSGEPDLKKLGERFYYIVRDLQKGKYHSFKELFEAFSVELPSPPKLGEIKEPAFSDVRFEQYDINDPLWLRRFEPEPALYEPIKQFDNTICSGPRGCGKTIYLRSLTFVPRLVKLIRDEPDKYSGVKGKVAFFDNIFGIYFACRQGEFKYFSRTYFGFTPKTQLFIKHIIALRIIKKTLSLINDAYTERVFSSVPKTELILKFLTQYLIRDVMMTSEAKERPFEQFEGILSIEENYCESILGEDKNDPDISRMLNEHLLRDFFNVLKNSVPELSKVKFYIILDDVSDPQVPDECQKIINSFMSCLNETYCCKFSTEKFAYTYEDMFGKALQPTNDYTYIDLSFLGGHEDRYVEDVYKQYLEKIINKRLEIAEYRQTIDKLLENLPYSAENLINLLSEHAKGNRKVYDKIKFAGWNLVVQLSSRSVRDAIAICDSIFREVQTVKNLPDEIKEGRTKIPVNIQDRAIRKHSREEYKGLLNITYHGKEIFDIVRNFGELSRKYLAREITQEEGRKYEMITIERRDAKELSEDAKKIFRTLIRYSVFIDRGLSFSREEIGLVQKITLHKKFTPALMTTYREREHLKLSKDKLEKFILYPDEFRQELRVEDGHQLKLFDFSERGDRNE